MGFLRLSSDTRCGKLKVDALVGQVFVVSGSDTSEVFDGIKEVIGAVSLAVD